MSTTTCPVCESPGALTMARVASGRVIADCTGCGDVSDRMDGEQPAAGLIVRSAADIVTRLVFWLWRNVFVGGAINLMVGMPDVGKSALTMDIAARKSTGTPWPVGEDRENPAGSVAILALEDSPETTVVPRLKAAGADLDKILIVEGVRRLDEHGETLKDGFDISRDVLRLDELRQTHPDLALVLIDPLDSYIGRVDSKSGNEVRNALWPLKDWCEQTGVTAIIVHHFNKSPSTAAIDRVSGSRSFGAMPRSVWIVGREDGESETVMLPAKLNLTRERSGMSYELRPCLSNPRFRSWRGLPSR